MANQIHVDPVKVDEVIRKMVQMVTDIREKEKNMKSYLSTSVSQYWRDAHYKAMMEMYEEFSKNIQRKLIDAEQVIIPHLRNVKKAAEEYNRSFRK